MAHLLRLAQRQPAGVILISTPDGKVRDMDTVRCAHCGTHWVPEPGSGRERGWCFRCAALTCGREPCETTCQTVEQWCERIERYARIEANIAAIRGT